MNKSDLSVLPANALSSGSLIRTKAEIYFYHLKTFPIKEDLQDPLMDSNEFIKEIIRSERLLIQPETVLLLLQAKERRTGDSRKFIQSYRLFCLLEDKLITALVTINVSQLEQDSIEFL